MQQEAPKKDVGKKVVLALIEKDGNFLLIKRRKPHLGLLWAFVGGIQKEGETDEETVIREAKEESNLDVEIQGNKLFEWKHPNTFVQIAYFHCTLKNPSQAPEIKEPYEIEEMKWVPAGETLARFTSTSHPVIERFVSSFYKKEK